VAYTTGDIVTRTQQRIRDTGYSSTEIKSYINDAQNDVFNEYRLPFMQAVQLYTLVSGDSDITNGVGLPTNYVQALNLTLTSTGQETVLPYRDIREIDELYPDPDDTTVNPTGPPAMWYYYADTIKVYPVPNTAYTVSLQYYKKPTELSADGDVPELPPEFQELLVLGAAYRVLQVKDNYDQAGVLQNKYDEILQKLVVKFSQPQVGAPTRMRINRYAVGKSNF
jgi:hypothetical protein